MRRPFLVPRGALAVMAVVSLTLVPVAAQAPSSAATTKAAAKTWTPPRTADGQPELQGIWNFSTVTPLERPSEFAGKEVLTSEEAAEVEALATRSRPGNDLPPEPGSTGTYNDFWWERGTKVANNRTSLILEPQDGKIPSFTPEAQKRRADRAEARRGHGAFDSWEDRPFSERCVLRGAAGPPMLPAGYNNNVQIFQIPGYVVLLNEQIHDFRVVPMDGRSPVPQNIRQLLGSSRGRWEGNTLVVDTANFTDRTSFRGSSADMRLTERFTRVDANTISYEFTVNDPTTYARPWTAALPMVKTDLPMYEYACHEGNYSLANGLRGARAHEAEEGAKKGSK